MPPKKKGGGQKDGDEGMTRIAIVSAEKCRPKKCRQECKKSCPVVKLGKLCIEVGPKSKLAFISEPLCIGMLGWRSIFRSEVVTSVRFPSFSTISHQHLSLYRLWYLREEVSI